MNVISTPTSAMLTVPLELATSVKYRKPPRCSPIVWVNFPSFKGVGRLCTPSLSIVAIDMHESSESCGLINKGDSVNDKERVESSLEWTMVKKTRPPTWKPE